MSDETTLTIGPETSSLDGMYPKVKPAPQYSKMPLVFAYEASPDGVDENLLIMMHGLGDKEVPFANLGKQLRLPQTAVLSLRAPERVPYLYEDAFQWHESFDQFGELLTKPNPTPAFDALGRSLNYLTSSCSWPMNRIHFFGFGQGGSVAAEFVLRCWKAAAPTSPAGGKSSNGLASIVSVEGPLYSYPTLKPPCSTPLLIFCHSTQGSDAAVTSFHKGFSDVTDTRVDGEEGMPRGKEEWASIIRFWGRVLSSRVPEMAGLHPVISGGPTPPSV